MESENVGICRTFRAILQSELPGQQKIEELVCKFDDPRHIQDLKLHIKYVTKIINDYLYNYLTTWEGCSKSFERDLPEVALSFKIAYFCHGNADNMVNPHIVVFLRVIRTTIMYYRTNAAALLTYKKLILLLGDYFMFPGIKNALTNDKIMVSHCDIEYQENVPIMYGFSVYLYAMYLLAPFSDQNSLTYNNVHSPQTVTNAFRLLAAKYKTQFMEQLAVNPLVIQLCTRIIRYCSLLAASVDAHKTSEFIGLLANIVKPILYLFNPIVIPLKIQKEVFSLYIPLIGRHIKLIANVGKLVNVMLNSRIIQGALEVVCSILDRCSPQDAFLDKREIIVKEFSEVVTSIIFDYDNFEIDCDILYNTFKAALAIIKLNMNLFAKRFINFARNHLYHAVFRPNYDARICASLYYGLKVAYEEENNLTNGHILSIIRACVVRIEMLLSYTNMNNLDEYCRDKSIIELINLISISLKFQLNILEENNNIMREFEHLQELSARFYLIYCFRENFCVLRPLIRLDCYLIRIYSKSSIAKSNYLSTFTKILEKMANICSSNENVMNLGAYRIFKKLEKLLVDQCESLKNIENEALIHILAIQKSEAYQLLLEQNQESPVVSFVTETCSNTQH